MGRTSVGAVLLLGLASVTLATYPGFSFLTSETRSYSPHPPVTRTQRGIAYIEAPTVIYASSPSLYPEATVFSDPLPVVPLPQLPAEFLTLKSVQIGGDDKATKKSRKGKGKKKDEDLDADDDVREQETEGNAEGGYPSSRQRQPTVLRERQNRNRGGNRASGGYPSSVGESRGRFSEGNNGASGGYPSSVGESRGRFSEGNNGASGGYPSSVGESRGRFSEGNNGASGGYPSSNSNSARSGGSNNEVSGGYPASQNEGRARSSGDSGVSGGYPSSSNANDGNSRRQQSRRNRNRNANENNVDNEFMRTGEDTNDAAEDVDDESSNGRSQSPRKSAGRFRGRGGSRFREENTASEEDEVAELSRTLSEKAQKLGTFYVPTFGNNVLNTVYPAFSQNALLRSLDAQKNEGYPESGKDVSAISISADDDEESDVEEERPRKSKSRESRRKSRPGRRGERFRTNDIRAQEPSQEYGTPDDSRSSGKKNRRPESEEIPPFGLLPSFGRSSRNRDRDLPENEDIIDDDEGCDECAQPLDGNQYGAPVRDSYGAPPPSKGYSQPSSGYSQPPSGNSKPSTGYSRPSTGYSQPQQGYNSPVQTQPQQSYGPVGYKAPEPQSQAYGVPEKSQTLLSYEAPVVQSGYSQPQQSYGAPSASSARLVGPRQISQTTSLDGFSNSGMIDQDLVKTVQAILTKYPN